MIIIIIFLTNFWTVTLRSASFPSNILELEIKWLNDVMSLSKGQQETRASGPAHPRLSASEALLGPGRPSRRAHLNANTASGGVTKYQVSH